MSRGKMLKEIEALEREARQREAQQRLVGFEPTSFQWEWIITDALTRIFLGPNQSGKTTSMAHEVVADALGYRAWVKEFADKWEKDELKYKHRFEFKHKDEILEHYRTSYTPPTRVAVVGKDFQVGIMQVAVPKIFELVDYRDGQKDNQYIASVDKINGKTVQKIHWRNGSVTVFFSGEQDDFRFEGSTWHKVYWDEPPKHSHYIGLKRGTLVYKGQHSFTMTPLSEAWIFEELVSDAKKEGSRVHMTTFNIYDEQVDWMSQEDKEDYERAVHAKNPHEVRARVYGEFTHLLGRVITNYNEDIHYISHDMRPLWNPEDDKGAGGGACPVTFGCTVDPHDRKPWAIAWWWVDQDGEVVFFDEWPEQPYHEIKSSDYSVADYAQIIKDFEEQLPAPVQWRFMDPNAGPRINGVTRRRLVDEMAMEGLPFDVLINDDLAQGHDAVRDYFAYCDDPGHEYQPKCYILETCWNINHSIMRYTWAEKRGDDSLSVKPHEKYKDFVDVVRYTVIKKPFFIGHHTLHPHNPHAENSMDCL